MSRVERALGPKRPAIPVMAYVAGGAALHFYTGARVSEEALPDCVGNRNRIKPSIGIACRLVVAAETRGHIRV